VYNATSRSSTTAVLKEGKRELFSPIKGRTANVATRAASRAPCLRGKTAGGF